VIGVDLLPIEPINNLNFIQGDFTESTTLDELIQALNGKEVDLVLSDMAPNLSGIKSVDQARAAYLVELVLDFAAKYLKAGGHCLIKVFHGSEFTALVNAARELFAQVIIRKPEASRSKSSETYLLCKNKKHI
jgi:23S rRNA (uridine2552-2'-O)-methyltransferase